MRKASLILVAVVLACIAEFWWYQRQNGAPPVASAATVAEVSVPAQATALARAPEPAVALQIDRQETIEVVEGTPLIFSVTIGNYRAANTMLHNAANRVLVEAIEADIAAKKIDAKEVAEELARLRQPIPVREVRLGGAAVGWKDYVQFAELRPDGSRRPLPWALRLAVAPQSASLALGAKEAAQLEYLLDPTNAQRIAPGRYQVLVALQLPAGREAPPGTWQGRVESQPVALTIAPRPAKQPSKQTEQEQMRFARYYQAAKDWPHALESAQKVRTANKDSIAASLLIGEVKEAQGDLDGALEAFGAGLTQFYQQHPKSYEPPLYTMDKIERIEEQLALGKGKER